MNPSRNRLAQLADQLRLPVIGAPMFIVSNPALVIAQCQSGIIGSIPALNARPQSLLSDWLTQIKQALAAHDVRAPQPAAPYAVNLIVNPSNERLQQDLDCCIEHQVPIIITSLRAPDEQLIERVHSYGGVVIHDVINLRHARKAVAAGVDGLVLVCAGAGGHAGTLSPFALVNEVRQFFDGPIALSGAIANGQSILASQALGADFAYIGTRFIATEEANAAARYKQMLVDHSAEDIVYTPYFTGVHGNYLLPSITAAGLDPEQLNEKGEMRLGSARTTKPSAWRDIWGSGQGLGAIQDTPTVAALVDRLEQEYQQARERLVGTSALT